MPQQKAEALYDFNPTADVELKIKKGDVIIVWRMNVGEGWWEGELNGMRGLFPSSYVKLLPAESPTHERSYVVDRPKTPLTPGSSKKAFMETLLAPPTLSQDHAYNKDRALELFMRGHDEIGVTVGPAWDCHPPTYSITVKHQQETRSSGLKRWSSYVVETKQLGSSVTRKYKHFLWLYDRLAEVFPCISLPPLPVKQYSGAKDPDGIEARRRGLGRFLRRVASHPLLGSTKLFHAFLTAKDDKDWKIGRHNSALKLSKSAKKLFGAPVYSAVKYPAYNVPLNQLASIEKFSKFSRLLEMNVHALESSCLHLSNMNTDMLNSLNLLGRDIQRFSKGLQPTTGAKRRKLLASTSVAPALANGGQASFHVTLSVPTPLKSAPTEVEGEESEEEEEGGTGGGDWNWREDIRFSKMTHDLYDIAAGMRQLSQFGLEHQEAMETQVVDVLRDYSGIIHTLPVLVKLHEEAMEVFDASKEKDSKKEAEVVRQHCDTLNNILLSEFDHFSKNMVQEFETMMESFLQEQANFHRQLADEWDSLHRRYRKRLSTRRQSTKTRSSGANSAPPHPFSQPKSGSFTASIASSQESSTSLPGMTSPTGGGAGRDTPSQDDLESSMIVKSHFNDSFEETSMSPDQSPDVTVLPSYISVERKASPSLGRAELSDSDVIDPDILKPKKKKSLPEPPVKPPNLNDARPPAETTPPSTTETLKTDAQASHQYATCVLRSKDTTPPGAGVDVLPPSYDTCVHKGSEVTSPPSGSQMDISARYETAFPHHVITVTNEDSSQHQPSHEYATLESPHEYANLQFALASKSLPKQKVNTAGTRTLPKKPVPIQRKRNVSDETSSDDNVQSSAHPTGSTKSSGSKKPLPPVKPAKLTADASSVSSTAVPATPPSTTNVGDLSDVLSMISNMTIPATTTIQTEMGGAPPLSLPPPMGKPRPLSSDFTELSTSHEEEDMLTRSVGAILPMSKPRSYTSVAQRPDLRKQPVLPHPTPMPPSSSATPPVASSPSSSSPGQRRHLEGQASVQDRDKNTVGTLTENTPALSATHEPHQKPKVNPATKPLLPSKMRGFGTAGAQSTGPPPPSSSSVASPAAVMDKTTAQVGNDAGSKSKAMPPPKPPRGNVSRAPPVHSNSVTGRGGASKPEDDPSPKGREELMRKLSLRRLRIEEQLASSTRLISPTIPDTSLKLDVAADNVSERNSGLSSSSSLSEVVVAYHTRKGGESSGGVGSTSTDGSSSSNGMASGGYGTGDVSLRRREGGGEGVVREGDENLAKYGIIEDESGGSYII